MFPLRVKVTLTVGALAAQDLVSTVLADTADDEIFGISLDATYTLSDHTGAEGPIDVGIAHSDYSAAEIEEWFEAQGAWDRSDLILREQARRRCRHVGTFAGLSTDEVLADGVRIRTPLKFVFQEGMTLALWAFNSSSATLTTGALVKIAGTLWCRKI